MGCVQWGCEGMRWARDLVCVIEAGMCGDIAYLLLCIFELITVFFFKDLLHRKLVRYTGLQNYEIVPLTNLP